MLGLLWPRNVLCRTINQTAPLGKFCLMVSGIRKWNGSCIRATTPAYLGLELDADRRGKQEPPKHLHEMRTIDLDGLCWYEPLNVATCY